MMKWLLWILALLLANPSSAQTVISGDAWTPAQVGVGTFTPGARLDILAGSSTTLPFELSDIVGAPMLNCDANGYMGVGLAPSARLDVSAPLSGSGASMALRNGNVYPSTGGIQLALSYNGSRNLAHALRTVHSTATANNDLDFLLWSPTVSTTSVGTLWALSLMTTSTSAFVHVHPVTTPADVELEISDGSTIGGGVLMCAAEGTHSSRSLKRDIAYLDAKDDQRAYEDVRALQPVWFRYKVLRKGLLIDDKKQPLHRGLIAEDVPASIRKGNAVIIDERVNNAEMALRELVRRAQALDASLHTVEERP